MLRRSIAASVAHLVVTACLTLSSAAADPLDSLRLDQIQVIGTHNSYHLKPDDVTAKLLRAVAPAQAEANDYSHATLTEQLERIGVRQLEFDLFLDPAGKLYRHPATLEMARQQKATVPPFDPDDLLSKPGIKVLHSPDFDFRTTVYTFEQALREVKAWSDEHRDHTPVFMLLELKADSFSPVTWPPKWDAAGFALLEKEIEAVFPRERILRPDDLRGSRRTLREAVLADGWPTLKESRGKVVFLLDNEGSLRDAYLKDSPALEKRLLFASVSPQHPAAAWMKRNNVFESFDEIQELVKAGFLVRTRADSDTKEARANDTKTRDKAFASGAQLISTDFPEVDERFKGYAVKFDEEKMIRANVVKRERD